MYLKEKRKVKIKYMILTAMILFLPISVKAINIEPSNYDMIYYNQNGNMLEDYSTPSYTIMFNQGWYMIPSNNNYGVTKISFRYNLTNIEQTYVTFVLYGDIQNGVAMLGGNTCEVSQFDTTGEVSNYSPGTYVGLICRNPKNNSWLDINMKRRTNGQQGAMYISSAVGTYQDPVQAQIAIQTTQDQTNWNNFNNQDISQQDQTPPDTSTIENVQQQEQQQITNIETAIANIQAPTFNLQDFRTAFQWIWQTIMYVFTTHSILLATMTIVLSLGLVKTIFGR